LDDWARDSAVCFIESGERMERLCQRGNRGCSAEYGNDDGDSARPLTSFHIASSDDFGAGLKATLLPNW